VPAQLCDPFRVKTQLPFWFGGYRRAQPPATVSQPDGLPQSISGM